MITQTQRVTERIPRSYPAQHWHVQRATNGSCYSYGCTSWLGLRERVATQPVGLGVGATFYVLPHTPNHTQGHLPTAQPSSGGMGKGGWPQVGLQPGGVGTGTERGSGAGLVRAKQSLPSAVSPNLKPKLERKKTPDTHTTKTNGSFPRGCERTPSPTPPCYGKLVETEGGVGGRAGPVRKEATPWPNWMGLSLCPKPASLRSFL